MRTSRYLIGVGLLGAGVQALTTDCFGMYGVEKSETETLLLAEENGHVFCSFLNRHEKEYADKEEFLYRLGIFKINHEEALRLTELDETATYSAEHSPFGDLTPEEFRDHYLFSQPTTDSEMDVNKAPYVKSTSAFRLQSDDYPANFDWVEEGKMTEVKNQGTLGTCWAFSAVTVIESQVAIKHDKLEDLSVEQLVECANEFNSSSGEADCAEFGGWPYLGFEYIEDFGGIYKDKDFPYCSGKVNSWTYTPDCYPCMPKAYDKQSCGDHSDLYCDKSTTQGQVSGGLCYAKGDHELVEVKTWEKLSEDEEVLKRVLKDQGPISVAMSAMILQFYFGGIISLPLCSSSPTGLDHAIVLVGYGEKDLMFGKTLPYWKVRNSWGKSWGEEGYFRLLRNHGMCGINLRPSIATVV